MKIRSHIKISMLIAITIVLALVMISFPLFADANPVRLTGSTRNPSIDQDVKRILEGILTRKQQSDGLQKYLGGKYSSDIELTLGDAYPVKTIYNPVIPGLDEMLDSASFRIAGAVTEWLVFICPKGSSEPVLFLDIALNQSGEWQEEMFGSVNQGGVGTLVQKYNELSISNECSSPTFFKISNEFVLLCNRDGNEIVIPESLLAHSLRLQVNDNIDPSLPLSDFLVTMNNAISRADDGEGMIG